MQTETVMMMIFAKISSQNTLYDVKGGGGASGGGAGALSNSNHTVTYRGIPAYSDSDGTLKKFHCKRVN